MRRILTIGRRCLSATGPAARPVARRSTRVRGTPTPMMSAIERGSGLQTAPIAARAEPSRANGCANAMRRILNIEKRFWSATAPFAGRIATRSTPRRARPMPGTTGIGGESGSPATSGTAPEKRLAQVYGLSMEDYNAMQAHQGGACAICKQPPTARPLFVDHCHATGKVRGLLGHACNSSLGFMRDDHTRTSAATKYLLKATRDDETK